jgi:hypothetical protein
MKYQFLNFLFLYSIISPLWAETWVILPFQVRNMPSMENRELNFKDETISAELAKAARTYLSIRGLKNIVPVEKVIGKQNLDIFNYSQGIKIENLQSAANKYYADYILVSQVSYSSGYYLIESKVFYARSKLLSNPIQSKDNLLLSNLSRHLDERFSLRPFKLKLAPNNSKPLIILLDSSGKNTEDISELVQALSLYDPSSSAFCSIDGSGNISKNNFGNHLKVTMPALKKLKAGGGGRYSINQEKLWECAKAYANQQKQAEVIALVGSMPAPQGRDYYSTKGSVRKLIESRRTLALQPSSLSAESRFFWNNTFKSIAELRGSYIEDVRYKLKAGLSNGTSLNIFQEGFKITGSLQDLPSSSSNWQSVPTQMQTSFRRSKLSKAYEMISGNTVITKHKVQGIYKYHLKNFWNNEKNTMLISNFHRSQLTFKNGSFWVSFPKKSAKSLNRLTTVNFLTHVEAGSDGIPYQNNPLHTYLVDDIKEVPDFLKIDLADYLVDSYNYKGKSFSGSTIYFFTGSQTK